ncbi:poly(U)-specific endoribonuclease homolog [Cephus cinctus]|uniref:Poly(U)-specific endoribonuclease homolog n=1 Tax=Cephus cinctus TaxID=211228 RepID=A0AAJ7CDT1_CEPCN|nr:poly(U)-specific endoribonuclease homolog [Cephus cinctus]
MQLKTLLVSLLVLSLIVGDVNAGWKFWKKKKDKDETTEAPTGISTSAPGKTTTAAAGGTTSTTPKSTAATTAKSTNKAVAGAADPGLAIGVGSTGSNIRNNAQPQRPNPGTDVGLDIPGPRPNRPGLGNDNGQGYRNWAADLTGAGERNPPPKLPSQGPALTPGGQHPAQGSRTQPQPASPGSRPGTPTSVTPVQPNNGGRTPPSLGPRPGSQSPSPTQQGGPIAQTPKPATSSTPGKPLVSTLNIGSLNPDSRPKSPTSHTGQSQPGSPTSTTRGPGQNRPGSPTSSAGSASPTGGKSWADIAATGTGSNSPTPAPRPNLTPGGSVTSNGQTGQTGQTGPAGSRSPMGSPGQTSPGQSRPSQVPVQPYGQPGHQGSQQTGGGGTSTGTTTRKVYSSNPTYSKGNTITDEDLEKLSEALFIKDVNNANRYITVNLQKKTTGSSPIDEAPQPLLNVRPEALQIPTIQHVLAIYDNYKLDTRTNEYISPAQRQEESLLVDTFLSTNVMSAAMRFLADKGYIRKDYYEYKDTLRRLWFNLFSRGDGKIGSTGFEHVFLTELKLGTEVIGLHNWIYFNAEEVSKRADYLGYIKKVDLGDKASIIKLHTKFNGIDKPVTTMFIGTSPELEMALYTVCFFARPDKPCPVSLGGTKFNIMTYKFRYRGKDLIGSAYPDI